MSWHRNSCLRYLTVTWRAAALETQLHLQWTSGEQEIVEMRVLFSNVAQPSRGWMIFASLCSCPCANGWGHRDEKNPFLALKMAGVRDRVEEKRCHTRGNETESSCRRGTEETLGAHVFLLWLDFWSPPQLGLILTFLTLHLSSWAPFNTSVLSVRYHTKSWMQQSMKQTPSVFLGLTV